MSNFSFLKSLDKNLYEIILNIIKNGLNGADNSRDTESTSKEDNFLEGK